MTAREYMRDITPQSGDRNSDEAQNVPIHVDEPHQPSRGIRNITVPIRNRHASTTGHGASRVGTGMREASHNIDDLRQRPGRFSRLWMWIAAALSLLVLSGLLLVAFRSTTVTVIPKSRSVALTDSISFVARPAGSSAGISKNTLFYTIETSDLEDSEVVPSQGTTHVESKASGSITIFNDYSVASVRLLKNTRFETPDGLIFRVPAEVVVPGKNSAGPGQVKVTVAADKAGEKYNVGAISYFTLPGLKTSAMYPKVYAKSTTAMTGGFVGEEPGIAPGDLNAAIAAVRNRLEAKAREAVIPQADSGMIGFPDLAQITYRSLPKTIEAGVGVRIHEKVHIEIPVFSIDLLAGAIVRSADSADDAPVTLRSGHGLSARMATTGVPTLGSDDIRFFLSENADVVWKIDKTALSEALAGRDSDAFQTIVNAFPGIQEAHAKIEPFWKKTFPTEASDIKILIVETEARQ